VLRAERGVEVDPVSIYRWVQRFTNRLVDAARPCRHAAGDRWFADETDLKVSRIWKYLTGPSISSARLSKSWCPSGDAAAARRFFQAVLACAGRPVEVTTDRAPVYPAVLEGAQGVPRR
jgi:transposase-like protein